MLVKEKWEHGGGFFPLIVGEDHDSVIIIVMKIVNSLVLFSYNIILL